MYDINRKELEDLLTYLQYTDEMQVSINKLYLTELVKIALESVE